MCYGMHCFYEDIRGECHYRPPRSQEEAEEMPRRACDPEDDPEEQEERELEELDDNIMQQLQIQPLAKAVNM